MRSATLLVSTLAILACEQSPTQPAASTRMIPPKSAHELVTGPTWILDTLPFTPMAMNNAGVIVGIQGQQEAVEWRNGALTILPHVYTAAGPYFAYAISAKGYIVGLASGHMLIWTAPNAVPQDAGGFGSPRTVSPIGITDNLTVVGTYMDAVNYQLHAFIWTPGGKFRQLPQGTLARARATGIASDGYIIGIGNDSIPLQWNPSGTTMRILPYINDGALTRAINASGTAIGNAYTGPCAIDGECPATVLQWAADGTVQELFNLPPSPAYAISDSGRIAGFDPPTDRIWMYYAGQTTWFASPEANTWFTVVGVDGSGTMVVRSGWSNAYRWRYASRFNVGIFPARPL